MQIAFVVYCMTFQMVIPVIQNKLVVASILIPFYLVLILILWSYIKCTFSDPGVVDTQLVGSHPSVDL